jgi:uncharacterized protein involved in response to NO
MSSIQGRPAARGEDQRFALWDLGFRPFYFVASVFAALSVVTWALHYSGVLDTGYLYGPFQHGHEMLFGFVLAVMTGFLFTAVRNWSGQTTPTGATLAGLVLLWLAGRLAALTPYALGAGIVNAAFPIAVAIAIGIPLVRSGNRRNYFFIGLLAILAMVELALHATLAGTVEWPLHDTLQVGLDVALIILAVVSGRVIPMFTNNGVPGAGAVRLPAVERAALGALIVLLAADLLLDEPAWILAIAGFAASAHAVRLALWRPWRTMRKPIVWILHAAYAWVVVHLALRALAALDVVPESLALHALTVGAIGGMTIGMMTRTARGHTGRTLDTDRFEVAMYALIQIAAVVRVAFGALLPSFYLWTVIVAATCWALGFGLYAIRYWPILSRPRVDGKPG